MKVLQNKSCFAGKNLEMKKKGRETDLQLRKRKKNGMKRKITAK